MPCPNSGDTPSGVSGAQGEGGPAGEFAAIARVRGLFPPPPPGEVWIGDDAAVLYGPGSETGSGVDEQLVLTTDLSVEGVHGDLAVIGLDDFGWRALASAVSDIAAMGGRVGHAVVAVAGPGDTDLDALYAGIHAASVAHGCPVVGGDLSSAPVLVVAVTVTGRVPVPPGPVLRSGALPGHELVVTGPLGASAVARRGLGRIGAAKTSAAEAAAFLRPRALLGAGEAARDAGASAMIDVSDGFGADLSHLADASRVGFRLEHVPCAPGATIEDALGGGEDYELVIATADIDGLVRAFADRGLAAPVRVGVCVEDPAERTLVGEPLAPVGWQHPFS